MKLTWPKAISDGRMPHVEVVVPCHNYGHYLPGCIDSIVNQPGVTTTVTIVDDTSTDDSAAVAERLAERYRQVRLIRNETNLGAWRTFNVGLRQADSDYVVLISADDLLAPGALGRATALMENNPTVGLVYGHAQKFASQPVLKRPMPTTSWTTWRGDRWIGMQLSRSWSNIASPEAVVRTRVHHEVGYYDPGLAHTADVEMWLRLAAVSDVGHINGVDQAYYRRQQVSHSARFSMYQDIDERWSAYSQFLTNWSDSDSSAKYRPIVRRRLSRSALFLLLQQLDHDDVDPETEAVLELAARIDPDVVTTDLWSDVQARVQHKSPAGLAGSVRTAARALAHRTRWHSWYRWRYFG